jgi:AraC-like DNA-binding protein
MENWKAVVYLLAAGQGLLLSLALVSQVKKPNKSNFFLGLILIVLSLELLNAWAMQVQYGSYPDAFPFWVFQSYLMLPPAIWLFAQLNTSPAFVLKRKYFLLFAPACIDILVQIVWNLWRHLTGEHLISLIEIKPWYLFAEILPIVGMIAVLYVYGRKLFFFSRQMHEITAPVHLLKLYGFFTFFVLLTVLWIGGVIIDLPVFSSLELILTLFLFALGYIGYFNPSFFDVPRLMHQKTAEVDSFPHYNDQRELSRLAGMFEKDGLHTRAKLSLEELAGELKLPPRYVSYLINTYHGTNFNHFVNTYRVEEVMRKISNPAQSHKTLLALALESGFSSKSTFNQVFKSHTGLSPSQYLLCRKEASPET